MDEKHREKLLNEIWSLKAKRTNKNLSTKSKKYLNDQIKRKTEWYVDFYGPLPTL